MDPHLVWAAALALSLSLSPPSSAHPSIRQSAPTLAGNYPQCDATATAFAQAARECMTCLGGTCPPGCCVGVTAAFNNQVFACRTDGCCARVLTANGAGVTGVILAREPVSAGAASAVGGCADIDFDAADCGPPCAVGVPDNGDPLDCPAGYDLPGKDDAFAGQVQCAAAEGEPANSPDPSPVLGPPGGDDSPARAAPTTAVPAAGGVSTRTLTTAVASTTEGGAACFPADALVRAGGGVRRVKDVQVGDGVLGGGGEYSEVFGFTHREEEGAFEFVELQTPCGRLRASEGHYVYVDGGLKAAGAVSPGDVLAGGDGAACVVDGVGRVRARGLYNPQTLSGDVVVDGLLVSTYTTAVEPALAHAALAWMRAAYRVAGRGWTLVSGAPWVAGVLPGGVEAC